MFRKLSFFILLIFLLLPAIIPLFKPYVSGTADGLGQRFRLVSFYNSLKEGNLRPRWAEEAAAGFGAPTFLFNYPLPYYLASFFHTLGFSINTSGQLLGATSLLLSGLFMFLAVRKLIEGVEGEGGKGGLERSGRSGKWAGLAAAVVYTYAPYHLQMTYLYDAWGEMLAFVWPPVILFFSICLIGQISQIGKIKYIAVLTMAWILFILSHNVSAVMFAPVILLLGFVIGYKRPGLAVPQGLVLFKAFILAVVIATFFWLPAFFLQNEMKYPQFLASEAAMRGSFFKSFSFQWETAIRVIKEGVTRYLDFTVGMPILFIGLIGLIRLIGDKKRFSILGYWVIGLLVVLLFSLYLTNYHSNWLWNLPIVSYPLSFILYPFRFLFVATFAGALLAGIVIGGIKKMWVRGLFGGALIIFTLIQGLPYTKPYIDIFPFQGDYFGERQTVSRAPGTRKNMLIKEFLPAKADLSFLEKAEIDTSDKKELVITKGDGEVIGIRSQAEEIVAQVNMKKDGELLLNRFYFPNWQATINGRSLPIESDNVGRMLIKLPKGEYNLRVVFGVSEVEKVANVVSLAGLIFLGLELFLIRKYFRIRYQVSSIMYKKKK